MWSRVALVAAPVFVCLAALLTPSEALAQYKNNSFGLDIGGWLISKPSLLDKNGNVLPTDQRPTRLANGVRIGGETSVKMSEDHWWFTGRVNVGFLRYGGSKSGDVAEQFDAAAGQTLGTLVGVQGMIGVRYVILTDRLRPYIQTSLSYMHLFSFTSAADDNCANTFSFCGGTDSNVETFLPHNDIGAFHVQPGMELVFTRDTALHIYADMQHWIVFNAKDNNAVVIGVGIIWFT
jgi:hypothetical protein